MTLKYFLIFKLISIKIPLKFFFNLTQKHSLNYLVNIFFSLSCSLLWWCLCTRMTVWDVCSRIIFLNVRLLNPSCVDINHILPLRGIFKKNCNKKNKTCLFMLTVPSQLSHYFNDYCYSNYQWVQLEKLLWRLLEVKNRSYLNMNRS